MEREEFAAWQVFLATAESLDRLLGTLRPLVVAVAVADTEVCVRLTDEVEALDRTKFREQRQDFLLRNVERQAADVQPVWTLLG